MENKNSFESIPEQKEKKELTVKIIEKFDEKVLQDILTLEKECFPEDWQL
jgi:hypothetical protein